MTERIVVRASACIYLSLQAERVFLLNTRRWTLSWARARMHAWMCECARSGRLRCCCWKPPSLSSSSLLLLLRFSFSIDLLRAASLLFILRLHPPPPPPLLPPPPQHRFLCRWMEAGSPGDRSHGRDALPVGLGGVSALWFRVCVCVCLCLSRVCVFMGECWLFGKWAIVALFYRLLIDGIARCDQVCFRLVSRYTETALHGDCVPGKRSCFCALVGLYPTPRRPHLSVCSRGDQRVHVMRGFYAHCPRAAVPDADALL